MLQEFLSTDIYKLILLFSRLGAAMMIFPGFASNTVFVRARLLLALLISFLLLPVLGDTLPKAPSSPIMLVLLMVSEITIGIFMGVFTLLLMTPIDLAGSSIGYAIGLTNVFTFDPITEQQSQLLMGFLALISITMVFVTDVHHLMLRALVDSYFLFKPGEGLLLGDFSEHLTRTISEATVMGFRLAAPLLIFSIAFNVGLAMTNRLVPQIPVFLVGLPVQIIGGFAILAIALPVIIYWGLNFTETGLTRFLQLG